MNVTRRLIVSACTAALCAGAQPPDIRGEGMRNSQVMRYAEELLDGIGPRLTGSGSLDRAVIWAKRTLAAIGLQNVHEEDWGEFGKAWQERHTSLRMIEPDSVPLTARAAPWSPSTGGRITGDLVAVRGFATTRDFRQWRSTLRGKIVLFGRAPAAPVFIPVEKPLVERLTEEQLAAFAAEPFERPSDVGVTGSDSAGAQLELMREAGTFFANEGVAAVLVPNGNTTTGGANGGAIHSDTNYTFGWFVYRNDAPKSPPLAILSVEHYGRLSRLATRGVPVRVEVDIDTESAPNDRPQVNILGEIAGVDPELKEQVVLVGAHLDSWGAAAGATDDGAGVLIAIEAMRILRALGVQPRRTIRIGLWTGEEQGALGSRAYVRQHFAEVPLDTSPEQLVLPEFLRRRVGAVVRKPGHSGVSAVYTLDAGGGRIRGISTGNPATVPLFREWLAPLRDLGVTMVRARSDCGGDCFSFEQAGLPRPSFKQDPLAYESQSHHTAMDVFEQLVPADLRQAAVVVATVLYRTAMHDAPLPR